MADLIEAVALVCFIFLLGVTLGVVIVRRVQPRGTLGGPVRPTRESAGAAKPDLRSADGYSHRLSGGRSARSGSAARDGQTFSPLRGGPSVLNCSVYARQFNPSVRAEGPTVTVD
jgi:hypothetical protein